MDNGWIKLHRKILNNSIAIRPAYFSLWITLLLKANHEPNKMIFNNNIMIVKEGQFITGRKQLSAQTGLSESTVERVLNYLEKDSQIEQQKNTKFRLITILNWKTYQDTGQQKNNKRTTNGQPVDTNKNEKNEKKDTIVETSSTEFNLKDEIRKLMENPRRELRIIGWFINEKRITLKNKEQFQVTIKRHLKPAKLLVAFEVPQLKSAADNADRQIGNKWTLETLYKLLTK